MSPLDRPTVAGDSHGGPFQSRWWDSRPGRLTVSARPDHSAGCLGLGVVRDGQHSQARQHGAQSGFAVAVHRNSLSTRVARIRRAELPAVSPVPSVPPLTLLPVKPESPRHPRVPDLSIRCHNLRTQRESGWIDLQSADRATRPDHPGMLSDCSTADLSGILAQLTRSNGDRAGLHGAADRGYERRHADSAADRRR